MALRFNMLLEDAGLDPADVWLLRHQTMLPDGRTPYDLWRADRDAFEHYQSFQLRAQRAWFASPFWACFLGLRDGRTLFGGIYAAGDPVTITEPTVFEVTGEEKAPGSTDHYDLVRTGHLAACSDRLFIEWGGGASGKRA